MQGFGSAELDASAWMPSIKVTGTPNVGAPLHAAGAIGRRLQRRLAACQVKQLTSTDS